jgi:probable F420-dependent oxidoreductase
VGASGSDFFHGYRASVPHDRRFRFAVIATKAQSAPDFRNDARKWEDLGYSTLFVSDHFVGFPLAPVSAMAMIAEATDRLRFGSLVLATDFRHPAVLAREAATLDLMSDGRLELGMGAGWMTADYEKTGIPLNPASLRIDRLAESLTVVRGLFADGPFTFIGRHYQVRTLEGIPKPVQKPGPPIIVGGGARRILTLAAREADIVSINANLARGDAGHPDVSRTLDAEATDQKLAWVREVAGPRFDDLEIQQCVSYVTITNDPIGTAEALAPLVHMTPGVVLQTPNALIGSVDRIVDDLIDRRERWQMSYVVVADIVAEEFAEVVSRLTGA